MKSKILLSIIILLAVAVRFVGLVNYPAGFNADEAALGYNAYSLLLTGRDEHGHLWPINLESFGDFKPALYAYLLIPFIKVFGLTEFAVRLPSAISGVLSVGLLFLLVKKMFADSKYRYLPHLTALVLAISPWAIHFSRGAWEVNVATTILLFSLWQYQLWLEKSKISHLLLFVTGLILSTYTYQSARIIAPLLGIFSLVAYFRVILSRHRQLLFSFVYGFILLLPLLFSIFTSDASSRFSGVGLLADEGPLNRVNELRGQHDSSGSPLSRLLHNRPVAYTLRFIKNYTDHFAGDFLFIQGDVIPRNRIPETGLLYLTDAVFLVLGLIFLIRQPSRSSRLIWIWLGIAPIASALTFQTPHALRAQNLVIPFTILVALGLHHSIRFLSNLSNLRNLKFLGYLSYLIIFSLYSYQFARFLHQYYVHYPSEYPTAWEYGFNQVADYVKTNETKYDSVVVTDFYDQPYILMLFYLQIHPAQFQNHHVLTVRDKFNFSTVRDFANYRFTNTSWELVRHNRRTLVVAAPSDLPPTGVNIIHTVYFPNGEPAFKIISL